MTEKAMKNIKNKKQHLKLKKPNAQQQQPPKVFDSDSDISEPEAGKPRPKIDHRELNQISSEVTDLLASLKKEHGIDNDGDDEEPAKVAKASPSKKDKKKLLDQPKNNNNNKQQQKKRAAEDAPVPELKKPKVEGKAAKQGQQQKKANANPPNNANGQVNGAQGIPSKKKDKNKNKKRPADDAAAIAAANDDDDDTTAAPPQAKKAKTAPVKNQKEKQKQKQKQKQQPNAAEKVEQKVASNEDDAGEDGSQQESEVKREHHLKNAVPVYVGNLPNNIKRIKLKKLFSKCGNILAIRFRSNSGMSLFKTSQIKKAPFIIAFIYFETREAAEASLALNGTQIGENVIVVDLDSNKREKFKQPQPNTVVVGNLKYAVTEQILRKAFKCCGDIEHIRTLQGPQGCKGIAFIQFAKPESCELALKLNGTEILDREIRVSRYTTKKKEKVQTANKKGKQQKGGKVQKNAVAKGAGKPNASDDADVAMHKMMAKKKKDKTKTGKEFMGTKSVGNKKVSNLKKKKKNKLSTEKVLAKKVAPKAEKTA